MEHFVLRSHVVSNIRSLIQMIGLLTIHQFQRHMAYIYIEGCFSKVQKEVKDSRIGSNQSPSNLYTVRELTINKDTVSLIYNCTSTIIEPSTTKQNSSNEITILSDDESDNTSTVIPACKLTMKDKHLIETGKQLTDILVNFACGLLKKQFPQFGGLCYKTPN